MSCSCTGNCDLININPLALSDTFHTWYDRTNEVITSLNKVNIYDVQVGLTNSGLTGVSTCQNGNYSGLLTIKAQVGPGIGLGSISTPNYYLNSIMLDVTGLSVWEEGSGYDNLPVSTRPDSYFPANTDWFIVSDVSDGTLGVAGGTPKKIPAQQMLPPKVYLPNGFEFNGDVYINGALTVENASTLASGEVAIEDSLIELAYVQTVAVGCTGITAPNNLGFPSVGLTLYYYDTTSGGTATPSSIARIQGITFAGDQTEIRLHKFTKGGVADIRLDGKLSVTGPYGPGSRWDFTVVSGPTTTTAFLADDLLDHSGIRIKGASGDKDFVWVYKEGPNQDIYNSFISTSNLGVSGSSNSIIASKFRSYGYSDSAVNNTFQFMGFDDGKPKIIIGGSTGQRQYGHHGYWAIQHDNRGITGATHQPLNFIFKKSTTDSESVLFKIASGASGQTFGSAYVTGQGSNTVTTFAQGFNSDFLDGAHGTTWSTPFSIPISMSDGKIARGWLPEGTEAITKCFTQASSGLVIGDVVRVNPDNGSLTFARADTYERAEALGIVSSVNGSEVCVVTKGFISLTGNSSSNIWDVFPLVTGNVYYLSSNDYGSLIKDPDGPLPITLGQIRKPMLLALSAYTGYVSNYLGIVSGEETDIVDSAGVIPIGMVMPYSGAITDIPYGWKLCDGTRLLKAEWAELYAIIGQNYYLQGRIPNDYATGPVTIVLTNTDSYDIQVGDCLQVEVNVNGIYYNADTIVASVGAGANYGRITVNSFSIVVSNVAQTLAGRTLRLRGRIPGQGQTGNPIFFLPDFRSRTLIGSTKNSGASFDGVDVSLGDIGGAGLKFISADQLPAHSHEIRTGSGVSVGSGAIVGIGNATNSETSNLSSVRYTDLGPQLASGVSRRAFDVMQPYATINWIIRAKRGLSALILSGHNHDDRYHPLQGNFKVSPYSAGFYGDWGVYHDIPSSYPQMRRPGGFTGMFISRWDMGLINSESDSVLQNFMYGDLSVFSDGITLNNLTGGGYAGIAFKLDPKISQVSIHGSTVNNLQPPKLKFTNIQAPNVNTFPIGQIIGLTSPKDGQDSYATNKFYTDTASKFIYNALPAGEFSASRNRPTGQFNVIAATGVVSPTEKTILSVLADKDPFGVGAKTEVHVRGDLSIYGNGLTGSNGNIILPRHTHGVFIFDTLFSRFRVIGGGTGIDGSNSITELNPPIISFTNRDPLGGSQFSQVEGDPIGIIEGLTMPTRGDMAANKFYVDREIKNRNISIPIASTSTTGVAMFNSNDFEVSSNGRVSIIRSIDDITISVTGSLLPELPNYPLGRIPAIDGVRGFNISTRQDLLGQGRPTRKVLSALANVDPRSANTYDSVHEVFINGDLTVFGDAYGRSSNRPAHANVSFAVDPVLNKVTIFGGWTAGFVNGSYAVTNETATPAPVLDFVDNRGGCRGKISGLTAPTNPCDAANKDYVDRRLANTATVGAFERIFYNRRSSDGRVGFDSRGFLDTIGGNRANLNFDMSDASSYPTQYRDGLYAPGSRWNAATEAANTRTFRGNTILAAGTWKISAEVLLAWNQNKIPGWGDDYGEGIMGNRIKCFPVNVDGTDIPMLTPGGLSGIYSWPHFDGYTIGNVIYHAGYSPVVHSMSWIVSIPYPCKWALQTTRSETFVHNINLSGVRLSDYSQWYPFGSENPGTNNIV